MKVDKVLAEVVAVSATPEVISLEGALFLSLHLNKTKGDYTAELHSSQDSAAMLMDDKIDDEDVDDVSLHLVIKITGAKGKDESFPLDVVS